MNYLSLFKITKKMENQDFPISIELRIDWSEIDTFGHVNNISYFKYIQTAKVNYLEKVGLMQLYKSEGIAPIMASCKCDFKQSLFYPGKVIIKSRIDMIKTTSFRICHQILNEAGKIAALAEDIIVVIDTKKNEKVAIPTSILEHIKATNR